MRETPNDLANEGEILDLVAANWKVSWRKLGNGGKYRIDAVLHDGHEIKAWVEVKDYGKNLFLAMNPPKYLEGCNLALQTDKPFLFVIRHQGSVGYLKLHAGGTWADESLVLRMTMGGGTPPGRAPNQDDYEPLYFFDQERIEWL